MTLYKSFSKLSGDIDTKVELYTPTALPRASSFLWNPSLLLHMNCRGYATAQFMQPEPAKYSHAPNIEAKTFMQPEQGYYAHHPARFFYVKDEDTSQSFSVPYEPMRIALDKFIFRVKPDEISWCIEHDGLAIEIKVTLAPNEPIEQWQISVENISGRVRNISVYPYFTIGYMSWMNQGADFDVELNAIVAKSISPYQQLKDYAKQKDFADLTYFLAEQAPDAWCANQGAFEGEGGLHLPEGINNTELGKQSANYEIPAAVMQYRQKLNVGDSVSQRFLFGPAKDKAQIKNIRTAYFGNSQSFEKAFESGENETREYLANGHGCLRIKSPDKTFDDFVNHWLPRQVFYHGDVNRLSTDPQTRNFLQDAMGMSFIAPKTTRAAFIRALSQQSINGNMPDGILMYEQAELKYINQVPHADHNVWLPICLSAYLSETNDASLLCQEIGFSDSDQLLSVKKHIDMALAWLLEQRDERGLNYIANGDWCDPMNMVGHKGKGVSTWLTLALAYALKVWWQICEDFSLEHHASNFSEQAEKLNQAVREHLWDGDWFARGITDDDVTFGIADDREGRIYLNPQSWSILSGAVNASHIEKMLAAINEQLATPYGVMMLAPSYTHMREDVGRLTQKHPGTAENGSVYNHAAAFYAYSLYQSERPDIAFDVLRKMLVDLDTVKRRGQLPIFIPNYYRGAHFQIPECSGRSSHLFNTGTVSWFYRCVIEELCGLKGVRGALLVEPKLPTSWQELTIVREFSGASFQVTVKRQADLQKQQTYLLGKLLKENRIEMNANQKVYEVLVLLPEGIA